MASIFIREYAGNFGLTYEAALKIRLRELLSFHELTRSNYYEIVQIIDELQNN